MQHSRSSLPKGHVADAAAASTASLWTAFAGWQYAVRSRKDMLQFLQPLQQPLQQPVFGQLSQVGNTHPPPPVSSDRKPMLLSSGKSELSLRTLTLADARAQGGGARMGGRCGGTGEMGEMGSAPAGQLEVRMCGSMMSMPDELRQLIVRECLSNPKSSDVGLVLMLRCVCKTSRREVFEILERAFQILTDGNFDRWKHPGFYGRFYGKINKNAPVRVKACISLGEAAKQAMNKNEWQAYVEKNRQKLERVFACSLLA